MEQVRQEIENQYHLRHEHILELYGYFHDELRIYMVLEYAEGGSLRQRLKKENSFDEKTTALYLCSLASALQYMHSHGVVHNDLKPSNLLLDSKGRLKLADFGSSYHNPLPRGRHRQSNVCGTLDYIPPEMVLGAPCDDRVDNWSLGILAYEFLVGIPPFLALWGEEEGTFERIQSVDMYMPDHLSKEAVGFIRMLLQKDPKDRMQFQHVNKHPFIKMNLPYRCNGDGKRSPERVVSKLASAKNKLWTC